jgi:hypothetical protein
VFNKTSTLIVILITLVALSMGCTTNEFEVLPTAGNYLCDTYDEPLEIVLVNAQIEQNIRDEEYFTPWYPGGVVDVAVPILVVNGTIRNEHTANMYISMFAEGYDGKGKQVAWTLDATHISGQILRYLDNDETGEFTIFLNTAENIETIRIFANSYDQPPP